MLSFLTICIDRIRIRSTRDKPAILHGWFIAERPLLTLDVALDTGEAVPIKHRLRQKNTQNSGEHSPSSERRQFSVDLPPSALKDQDRLHLRFSFIAPEAGFKQHEAELDLRSSKPQRITIPPARPTSANLPTSREVETALHASMQEKPGISLRLDIINKCNLRCVMCHYSDDAIFKRTRKELTPETFGKFFSDVAPFVRSVILSCGDEPLLSRRFGEILAIVADDAVTRDIEFCTNAMLMNAEIRGLLIEKGVTDLMLSMDGATRETMERIRKGSRFDRVVGNILALRDLKKATGSPYPRLTMDFVMMNSNIHEAPAFVEMCHDLGMETIDFRHAVPSEFWDDPAEKLVNFPAKYNFYRKRILEEAKRFALRVYIPPALETAEGWEPGPDIPEVTLSDFRSVQPDAAAERPPVPRIFPPGFRPRDTSGSTGDIFSSTFCERPFSEIMLTDDDAVRPCAWHRKPLGHLRDGNTLSEIFFGEEFQSLRRNMFHPEGDPNCRGCPIKVQQLPSESQAPDQGAREADGSPDTERVS